MMVCGSTSEIVSHIERALRNESKLTPEVLAIDGKCGIAIKHLLNNICSSEARHLDVGTGSGSSIIAASFINSGLFYTIDHFIKKPHGDNLKAKFLQNNKVFNNYISLECDCFKVDFSLIEGGLTSVFYDADHKEQSVFDFIVAYNHLFARQFVLIVDDWNDLRMKCGVQRAFKVMNYKVLFEKEIFTPFLQQKDADTITTSKTEGCVWWNGVYIALVEKMRLYL